MARYWLGPWVWGTAAALPSWVMPTGAAAAVDLRTSPQSAAAGGTPQGVGLFVTPNAANLGASYTDFGTDPTAVLSGVQKSAWQTLCGLPNALSSNTLQQALYETLTVQSDPTGQANVLPLDATTGRRYELWVAGQLVRSGPFNVSGAEAGPLRQRLQATYRALRQRCLDGASPPAHYRRVLGYWVRKYGVAYRWFQPPDLPDEADLPPATTLADDFNRADQTGLGTGPAGTWAAVLNNIDIVSNKAERDALSEGLCRLEADLSGADHYAQYDALAFPSSDQFTGCYVRFDPTANTGYRVVTYTQAGGAGVFGSVLQKMVSGTGTTLDTQTFAPSLPETYKLQANGTSISHHRNGVVLGTVTDSGVSGNLRTGLDFYNGNLATGPSADNFLAADLGAGRPPQAVRVGGALSDGGVLTGGRT